MPEERGLLGIINCLGPLYNKTISFYDVLVFGLGSIVLISLLLFYYSKISRKRIFKNGKEYIEAKKDYFIWVNIFVCILALFLITSSIEKIIKYSDMLILVSLGLSIFYLNYIHKGTTIKRVFKQLDLKTPIYNQSKDILLQEKSINGIYLTQEKNLSIWMKLTIYLFIIIAITTPLYQLFGTQHFI